MPIQYASVENAAEAAIRFICTQKHVNVDDFKYNFKIQVERKLAASDTYQRLHQAAETATKNMEALNQAYKHLLQRHIHPEHTT